MFRFLPSPPHDLSVVAAMPPANIPSASTRTPPALLGVPVSTGFVARAHERFADLLAGGGFDQAMIAALRAEAVLCADETPVNEDRERRESTCHLARARRLAQRGSGPTGMVRIAAVKISDVPFGITDWSTIDPETRSGESGHAEWRTRQFGDLRVRMVRYSENYFADHWCNKGHILLCIAGRLDTELADGRVFTLTPGTSYQVADDAEPHRSRTDAGAVLFIVD
jgi:hypothetical protein